MVFLKFMAGLFILIALAALFAVTIKAIVDIIVEIFS